MSQTFIKRMENFTCAECGEKVVGDGYTNHCPKCLFSQHVDVNPGDRASDCGGLMPPIAVEYRNGVERVIHRCLTCGKTGVNRVSERDDLAVIARLLLQSNSYKLNADQRHD